MGKNKKSKEEVLEKLHRILDELSIEDLNTDEKKYMISLAKRIEETYGPAKITNKKKEKETKVTVKENESRILKPKVAIHSNENRIKRKVKSHLEEKIKSEDLIEIEKIDSVPPEFIEIKPKIREETEQTSQDTYEFEHESSQKTDKLTEWEPIKVKEEKPSDKGAFCPHCGSTIDENYKFCPSCGKKLIVEEIEEESKEKEEWKKLETKKDVEEKKVKEEKPEETKPETNVDEEKKEELKEESEEKEKKRETSSEEIPDSKDEETDASSTKEEDLKKDEIDTSEKKSLEDETKKEDASYDNPWDDAFKDLTTIDNKTAELLYQNGIVSLELLKNTTVKELKRVRGIRARLAKAIKREVNQLSEEETRAAEDDSSHEDEWKEVTSEWVIVKDESYTFDGYTLYERKVKDKNGKKRTVRFFSKKEPADGTSIDLPKGYEVKKNKRTGVPYLRKRK